MPQIIYLKNKEIDKQKWDNCIQNAINSKIYAYSWYLNSVCENWDAIVTDDYSTVLPLPIKKIISFHFIYQPFWTQQLGLFSLKNIDNKTIISFINAIPSKYKHIEINLNSGNYINFDKYNIRSNVNIQLAQNYDYNLIYNNYSTNIKRNINKALKAKIQIANNVEPDEIIKIFAHSRGSEFKHIKDKSYKLLKQLINNLISNNKAYSIGAYTSENQLCAGIIIANDNNCNILLFSATNEYAKKNGAMSLLIDNELRKHENSKLIFDFEGSNNSNQARFYKSFGGSVINYQSITINKLPYLVKLLFNFKRNFF